MSDGKVTRRVSRTRKAACCQDRDSDSGDNAELSRPGGLSRRAFLGSMMAGFAASQVVTSGLAGTALADDFEDGGKPLAGRSLGRRVLLKGGVVMTMDPNVADLAKGDVLIEDNKIVEVGPNISAGAQVIDASGMIVMPGFVDTHHHTYHTIIRSVTADDPLQAQWPVRNFFDVGAGMFTNGFLFTTKEDLGRPPYDPDDVFITHLAGAINQINNGITTGVDTSQCSHNPDYTDNMIEALMASGRRSVYAYYTGRGDDPRFEYPGARGNTTSGLGRLAVQFFSSPDRLVTLALAGGPRIPNVELARAFGVRLFSHAFNLPGFSFNDLDSLTLPPGTPGVGVDALAAAGLLGPDQIIIHANQFSDQQFNEIFGAGVHVSISTGTEMPLGLGMSVIQQALDHGVIPSISTDAESNIAADMFTLMRTVFLVQRANINQRIIAGETNVPPAVNSPQVLQMATIAGAQAAGLDKKIGSLTPGKEADIIMLDARRLNTTPLNNAPGTVVTLMDTSNVDTVFIAGRLMKWQGQLVGVDVDKLRRKLQASRDRVVAFIQQGFPGFKPTPNLLGPTTLQR